MAKFEITYSHSIPKSITELESEELNLLEDLKLTAPVEEFFVRSKLSTRLIELQEKKLMAEMEPLTQDLSKQILDWINESTIETASGESLEKIRKLIGIVNP